MHHLKVKKKNQVRMRSRRSMRSMHYSNALYLWSKNGLNLKSAKKNLLIKTRSNLRKHCLCRIILALLMRPHNPKRTKRRSNHWLASSAPSSLRDVSQKCLLRKSPICGIRLVLLASVWLTIKSRPIYGTRLLAN